MSEELYYKNIRGENITKKGVKKSLIVKYTFIVLVNLFSDY